MLGGRPETQGPSHHILSRGPGFVLSGDLHHERRPRSPGAGVSVSLSTVMSLSGPLPTLSSVVGNCQVQPTPQGWSKESLTLEVLLRVYGGVVCKVRPPRSSTFILTVPLMVTPRLCSPGVLGSWCFLYLMCPSSDGSIELTMWLSQEHGVSVSVFKLALCSLR